MLSRSFNSNYAAVSSFHYGSSRDLHGSQGSVALSVADGRGSGVHIVRVSTYRRLLQYVEGERINCERCPYIDSFYIWTMLSIKTIQFMFWNFLMASKPNSLPS